jgi:hypothetical protein
MLVGFVDVSLASLYRILCAMCKCRTGGTLRVPSFVSLSASSLPCMLV